VIAEYLVLPLVSMIKIKRVKPNRDSKVFSQHPKTKPKLPRSFRNTARKFRNKTSSSPIMQMELQLITLKVSKESLIRLLSHPLIKTSTALKKEMRTN
jgi:hypothetical protein